MVRLNMRPAARSMARRSRRHVGSACGITINQARACRHCTIFTATTASTAARRAQRPFRCRACGTRPMLLLSYISTAHRLAPLCSPLLLSPALPQRVCWCAAAAGSRHHATGKPGITNDDTGVLQPRG